MKIVKPIRSKKTKFNKSCLLRDITNDKSTDFWIAPIVGV